MPFVKVSRGENVELMCWQDWECVADDQEHGYHPTLPLELLCPHDCHPRLIPPQVVVHHAAIETSPFVLLRWKSPSQSDTPVLHRQSIAS
jgi:hypothetical protein